MRTHRIVKAMLSSQISIMQRLINRTRQNPTNAFNTGDLKLRCTDELLDAAKVIKQLAPSFLTQAWDDL